MSEKEFLQHILDLLKVTGKGTKQLAIQMIERRIQNKVVTDVFP